MHDPRDHIVNKVYHVEVLPPKQDSSKLLVDLDLFKEKYLRVLNSGYCVCIKIGRASCREILYI